MSRAGKTYVVSGGASGLGEATCRLLCGQGANVAILDRDEEKGKALVAELGANALFVYIDATKEDTIKAAVAQVEAHFGGIDGAVTCAGVGAATTTYNKRGPHNSGIFDFVLQINLYGVFNVCKYCAEAIAKRPKDADGMRGVLINCASVAAFDGQKGQVAYAASKGAVVSMTLPMARDLARYGIRVNTIAPGIFDTPLMAMSPDPVRDNLLSAVVSPKRFGLAPEFAKLCTSIIDNSYLNGETIRLDGGLRMQYSSKL